MSNYPHALNIVKKLASHGHVAYFAGGWVRDYVMGHPSEDIDIATSASPDEILDLFPKTLIVGIQFGIVVVLIDGHSFEVATFRKDLEYKDGRKPEGIEQTTPQLDAMRRDFTINGMFYDPIEEKIHDYTGGMEDIERGMIRAIGNPYDRFFEDRLRMIRAFRFMARLSFKIDFETEKAIEENALGLFPSVAIERIWQEFCKMSAYPSFDRALIEMHRVRLLQVIFPSLEHLHLHELEKRVAPIKKYPKNTPEALFLRELFPDTPPQEVLDIGRYLKSSNKDLAVLSFYMDNYPFDIRLAKLPSAKFYAHPDAEICLAVYAARLENGTKFLNEHADKKKMLDSHIQRILEKKPVISSTDLVAEGIKPGIAMGRFLKEAEKIAIEHDLHNKDSVLILLKQTTEWQQCTN